MLSTETRTALPSGTVTFLFTDIEGSTRLWQKFPKAMPDALAQHHALLQNAMAARGGCVFQIIGDAFCAAFASARDALDATERARERIKLPPTPHDLASQAEIKIEPEQEPGAENMPTNGRWADLDSENLHHFLSGI